MRRALWPLYEWAYADTENGGPAALRSYLDLVWTATTTPIARNEIERAMASAIDLVPADEEWSDMSPLVENAAASVAHALRTALDGDPNDACMSARQMYEAADFVVQRGAALHAFIDDIENEPSVQLVLDSIDSSLREVAQIEGEAGDADLRARAAADGRTLLDLVRDENPRSLLGP